MKLPPFKLEEFWKRYEFSTPYLLCPSDCESWKLNEILAMAGSEAKGLWDKLELNYTESPGLPLLRKEIALQYNLDVENVLTTAGAEEGIYCTMQALVEPEDEVIVITPCYQSLKSIPIALGAKVHEISLTPDWKIEINVLARVINPKTKLIVLNIPHNPTGSIPDKALYQKIIDLAKSHGSYVFCDEVYQNLEVNESDRLPSIANIYEKGISLNVMSKSFGLAGLRIGWLVSKDTKFLEKANSYKLYTSICNSAPSEILALIALRAKDKILARNRQIILQNLEAYDQFFAKYPKLFTWKRPQAGSVAFPEFHGMDIDRFTEMLAKEAGILIMPSSIYEMKSNHFRIGLGRSNVPEILARFEEFLSRKMD